MTLPSEATFVADLGEGVALYDVSHLLPVGRARKSTRPRGIGIERLYFHHSGATGRQGFKGAYNSARYMVKNNGFPTAGYHYWISIEPDVDNEGRLVCYRLVEDAARAWHTGGKCNDHGLGIAFQGNLSEVPPSEDQLHIADRLTSYLLTQFNLSHDALSYHSEASKFGGRDKAACPGPHVEKWVNDLRAVVPAITGTSGEDDNLVQHSDRELLELIWNAVRK